MIGTKKVVGGILGVCGLLLGTLFGAAWLHESEAIDYQSLTPPCDRAAYDISLVATKANDRCQSREWYVQHINNIAGVLTSMAGQGSDIQSQAMCAYSLRRQARLKARAMMSSDVEVSVLRVRDWLAYGHFDGPEFDQLLGDKVGTASYERIIRSAQASNERVDNYCES